MSELATEVAEASDEAFSVVADEGGHAIVQCKLGEADGVTLGQLGKGADILTPVLQPNAAAGALEGEALAAVVTRANAWIEAELVKHIEGLRALSTVAKDPVTPGSVRALAVQMVEALGILPRRIAHPLLKDMDKDMRATARKAGVHYGALDIYHYAMMKPRAVFWRNVLSSVWHGHAMQVLPDGSAVHLAEWDFANEDAARLAGYRGFGGEYLRVDLADRLIKQAHEKRGEASEFAVDVSYATSLGLSETGLIAVLTEGGFRRIEPPEVLAETPVVAGEVAADPATAEPDAAEPESAPVETKAIVEAAPTVEAEPRVGAETVSPPAAETAPEPIDPDAPVPEVRVGDKGEFLVVGNSFFYEGPKLWFAWGRERSARRSFTPRGEQGAGQGSGQGEGDRQNDRSDRRRKGENAGTFKSKRHDGDRSDGPRRNDSRRGKPDGERPDKAFSDKPRALSALAEALGAQLAARKDKD